MNRREYIVTGIGSCSITVAGCTSSDNQNGSNESVSYDDQDNTSADSGDDEPSETDENGDGSDAGDVSWSVTGEFPIRLQSDSESWYWNPVEFEQYFDYLRNGVYVMFYNEDSLSTDILDDPDFSPKFPFDDKDFYLTGVFEHPESRRNPAFYIGDYTGSQEELFDKFNSELDDIDLQDQSTDDDGLMIMESEEGVVAVGESTFGYAWMSLEDHSEGVEQVKPYLLDRIYTHESEATPDNQPTWFTEATELLGRPTAMYVNPGNNSEDYGVAYGWQINSDFVVMRTVFGKSDGFDQTDIEEIENTLFENEDEESLFQAYEPLGEEMADQCLLYDWKISVENFNLLDPEPMGASVNLRFSDVEEDLYMIEHTGGDIVEAANTEILIDGEPIDIQFDDEYNKLKPGDYIEIEVESQTSITVVWEKDSIEEYLLNTVVH
ncbi:hypothetical protein G6M89_21110 [Natronolimnobius sp. AArcel1]|uniref:hypothetical protein n=1 Tax=Natronolimnobius sp. AArcel1 TaxID=1679093 RepID=UPI0013EBA19D|nr:hypothetical protein [Natronolimnobius sp. AArcel1]NGM71453.1 hypothetical protein [Natronolimnobius sp. AArcel1]